jgi:hypothetical protein
MSYNKTINDFQFRLIQGLINLWNMVFKMINIYWFVSNSNEMVRQHIHRLLQGEII